MPSRWTFKILRRLGSKAPLCLMTVAAAVFLWSTWDLMDDEEMDLFRPRWNHEPFNFTEIDEVNFSWVLESQSRKAKEFLISKGLWRPPSDWQPQMDFGQNLAFNNTVNILNSSLEAQSLWITCADQYQECACYGKIRWGIEGRWIRIAPAKPEVANRIQCQVGKQKDVPELIDVAPGDEMKHCECQVNTSTYFFLHVNVWSLPKAERKHLQLEEASNCPLMAADETEAGRLLWQGMEGICLSNWSDVAAGSKAMPPKKMTNAIKSYIPQQFAVNYHRFYQDNWLPRAFVTYFTGPLEGSESQAVETLIDSVHQFSVYPIVVLHGGMATPLHWNPEIFPRLILFSIAELPWAVGLRATHLLAAVISHVESGIFLGHASVVFPGIDRLFAATEREIHAAYPYPMLPVHYSEVEDHSASYWTHVCAEGVCKQTMHWGHLGSIFWSKHALPFLATALRALLRDETYPAEAPYKNLRVRRTLDIETFINLALWKVDAYKQWCKLDVALPEAAQWLRLPDSRAECVGQKICVPAKGGPFLPQGMPRIFVSTLPDNNFTLSREVLAKVEERKRKKGLPDPIVFQKMYRTGQDLKREWPDMPCLLGL